METQFFRMAEETIRVICVVQNTDIVLQYKDIVDEHDGHFDRRLNRAIDPRHAIAGAKLILGMYATRKVVQSDVQTNAKQYSNAWWQIIGKKAIST